MKTIEYKGIRIAENTEAYLLWEAKEFGKLDEHLKVLESKKRKLKGQ
jgi:uncharacterized protein (DUF3820 family)